MLTEVAITTSGIMQADCEEGTCVGDLITAVVMQTGIRPELTEGSFVLVHNNVTREVRRLRDDECIPQNLKAHEVLKVILPLKFD